MLFKVLVSLSLMLLAVSNTSANEVDKLVGTYSANFYGERSDRYRVEKHGSSFWLLEKVADANWKRIHEKGLVQVINKKQFEKMMKKTVNGPAYGLNFNNRVVIFKGSKGFTIGKQKMATGYFVFFDGIFLELRKEK